ncbi:MAG TPA: transcription termination factor NusA, partial [Steroidobacteraceae bacterium]|nr:transcription termination factor NusA [Steroidobacteraceae bacterium]
MNKEILMVVDAVSNEKGVDKEIIFTALEAALASATRKRHGEGIDVRVAINRKSGDYDTWRRWKVFADDSTELENPDSELRLDDAAEINKDAQVGDYVEVPMESVAFGRIAAQTAKQVILQRVREAERDKLYEDYSDRQEEILTGTVQSVSAQSVTVGLGRTEAVLPRKEMVPGERFRPYDKIRVYVVEVKKTSRGPQIVVSRNHKNMLKRLLELEVPEIYSGAVEIKSIAREAGQRSKVAVAATHEGVDPVGACVGVRGVRIQSIVRELNDEKIDVIEWSPDPATFIAKALSPARVSNVFLDEDPQEGKIALVVVPDDQLSLAIGREGQNARLAAKLTGWRIDIKS